MTACIDLRQRFGDRFQIELDESYHGQYGENARTVDPWYMQIRCQHGHIYAHGGDVLAASTSTRGGIARKLAGLDCTTVVQSGSDGINVTFHARDFERVAEVMKPNRRRRLTAEQRRAAAERLAKYAFKPARQSDSDERKWARGTQSEDLTEQSAEGAGAA